MPAVSFSDDKLDACIKAWLEQVGASLGEESRQALVDAYRSGWAASLQQNLEPAIDLCIIILRLAHVAKTKGDYKLVLTENVLELLVERCKAVVGDADMEALAGAVAVEEISEDSEGGD